MNIAQEILRTLEEFNISSKIVALTIDNNFTMLVCGKEITFIFDNKISLMNFSHYRCAAYVLNLGVKKGLKNVSNSIIKACKIMSNIKNLTCLCDSLCAFCDIKKINYLKPILDVKTC